MPFDTKDTEVYRRNEKAGGKLLTPEERLRLLEVRSSSLILDYNDC